MLKNLSQLSSLILCFVMQGCLSGNNSKGNLGMLMYVPLGAGSSASVMSVNLSDPLLQSTSAGITYGELPFEKRLSCGDRINLDEWEDFRKIHPILDQKIGQFSSGQLISISNNRKWIAMLYITDMGIRNLVLYNLVTNQPIFIKPIELKYQNITCKFQADNFLYRLSNEKEVEAFAVNIINESNYTEHTITINEFSRIYSPDNKYFCNIGSYSTHSEITIFHVQDANLIMKYQTKSKIMFCLWREDSSTLLVIHYTKGAEPKLGCTGVILNPIDKTMNKIWKSWALIRPLFYK